MGAGEGKTPTPDPVPVEADPANADPVPADPTARFWKPALIGILLFSALLRLWGLDTPKGLVFDEAHHSAAAAVIVGADEHPGMGAWSDHKVVGRSPDPSFVHPPLGKLLIGAGIRLFKAGDGKTEAERPGFGRRIPSALFGIASLLIFFLIAYQLLGSGAQATVAVGLLAADGLHLVQSRIGMLDMFLFTFGLVGVLGLLKMLEHPEDWRWRVVAGVAWGLALAVKLNTVLGALGCAVLWLWLSPLDLKQRLIALGQVILPAALITVGIDAVYYMSNGFTLGEWVELRTTASTALAGAFESHQYGSYPGEWLWNKKPIWYAFERIDDVGTTGIVALGNPFIWLALLPASYFVFAALKDRWRRQEWNPAERVEWTRDLIPVVWFLATYLPLHLVLWRREGFLYYMLPSTAPMCLIITRAWFQVRAENRWMIWVYLGLVGATLLALIPVLIGAQVPEGYFTILFKFISA